MILISALALCAPSFAQKKSEIPAEPDRFEIGRDTFFDFGPPFDYYEIFVVRPADTGSVATRILLTPPTDACFVPAKLEVGSAPLKESVSDLLGPENPCAIPERALHKEEERCKHCLVFSGADVSMQVPCGTRTRVIKARVLEQDWFEKFPNTPKNTLWTMTLVDHLDKAVGPGVMEKPMFPGAEPAQPSDEVLDSEVREKLASGKYDLLFEGARDKASELYVAAQKPPVIPAVRVVSVDPLDPETLVLPEYPPIARMIHFDGSISVSFEIGFNGVPISFMLENGPQLLYGAVTNAVTRWHFPQSAAGQRIYATFQFDSNCHRPAQ